MTLKPQNQAEEVLLSRRGPVIAVDFSGAEEKQPVRAELIAQSIEDASKPVEAVDLRGIKIVGELKLPEIGRAYAFALRECRVEGPLDGINARLSSLSLIGTWLMHGADFSGALVEGQFLMVGGKVFKSQGKAHGEANLRLDRMHAGDLVIEPQGDDAPMALISMRNAQIERDVVIRQLRPGWNDEGCLVDARSLRAGSLSISEISFGTRYGTDKQPDNFICLALANIAGRVELRDLHLQSEWMNVDLSQLVAHSLEVSARVKERNWFGGGLSLSGARLSGSANVLSSAFKPGGLAMTGLQADAIRVGSPAEDDRCLLSGWVSMEALRAEFVAIEGDVEADKAELMLMNSRIDGLLMVRLRCSAAKAESYSRMLWIDDLSANNIIVDFMDSRRDEVVATRFGIRAYGSRISENLQIDAHDSINYADLRNMRVGQNVSLVGTITDALYLEGTSCHHLILPDHPPKDGIDLARAKVEVFEDSMAGWGSDRFGVPEELNFDFGDDDEDDEPEIDDDMKQAVPQIEKLNPIILDGFEYGSLVNPFGGADKDGVRDVSARIRWLRRQRGFQTDGKKVRVTDFNPQPWRQLALTLQKLGFDEQSKRVTIERRRAYRESNSCGFLETWWLRLLDATGGFGFKPSVTIAWSLLVIVAFAVLFAVVAQGCQLSTCMDGGRFVPLGSGDVVLAADADPLGSYPGFNALLFSIDQFVPLVDFGPANLWGVNSQWQSPLALGSASGSVPSGKLLAWAIFFERLIGTFLTAYAIIGLNSVVKREA